MKLPFDIPPFQPFWFFAGFAAAALIGFLLFSFRQHLSRLRDALSSRLRGVREALTSGAERSLREEVLQAAQAAHLAGAIFSLDQILVPPRFLIPDPGFDPGEQATDEDLTTIIPIVSEWPDLAALYHAPVLDVDAIFAQSHHVAVLGGVGCGKSTVLAHLAARAAQEDPTLFPGNPTPIWIHAADLTLPLQEDDDLAQPLIAAAQMRVTAPTARQLPKHLRTRLKEFKCVIFLDGFDEMPPKQALEVAVWLEAFQKEYPGHRLIAAAGLWGYGPLVKLGFAPVYLAPWGADEFHALIKKWGAVLTAHRPSAKADQTEVDPRLIMGWLSNGNLGRSVFEITLRIWAAFAGDMRGSRPVDWLEAYLLRRGVTATAKSSGLAAAAKIAAAMLVNEDFLGAARPGLATLCDAVLVGPTGKVELDSDDFLDDLVKQKILVKRSQDRLSFQYPLTAAYSAALELAAQPDTAPTQLTPLWVRALYFFAPLGDLTPVVSRCLHQPPDMAYTDLFACAQWLRDTPLNARWRSDVFRRLSKVMLDKESPESLRLRGLTAMAATGDPSVVMLFKQVLVSPDPFTRRLAALGLGACGDATVVPQLVPLFADSFLDVRWAAALALMAIGSEAAINALVQGLMEGDDEVRRACAQALARHPEAGHPLLKEAVADQDISTRRAAVYGLAAVGADWAMQLLENVQVNEQQWIVRNAAVDVLEHFKTPPDRSPKPYPAPDSLGWLVAWAAAQGTGVPPGKAAVDIVNKALREGDIPHRRAAAEVLGHLCDPAEVHALYSALRDPELLLRDAAFRALLQVSTASGQRLSTPV